MVAAFFLPWGGASLMGLAPNVFSAYDLAQHDGGWNIIAICGMLTFIVGVAGLAYTLLDKVKTTLYFGAGALMFSLVPGIFVTRMLLRIYSGEGVRLGWLEGATAQNLALSLRIGVPLVLLGALLGTLGGLWSVYAAKREFH